jgi:F-type H+-transporting ATPase subunit alpha
VHEAATQIPTEICARFETADKLNDEDRQAILELTCQALAPFLPKEPDEAKLTHSVIPKEVPNAPVSDASST